MLDICRYDDDDDDDYGTDYMQNLFSTTDDGCSDLIKICCIVC